MSAAERLYDLATAAARSVVVVGHGEERRKDDGVQRASRGGAAARHRRSRVTSIGRDGEPFDALDAEPKPRVRLAPGTLVALAAALLPRTPALAIVETGAGRRARPDGVRARVLPTLCEIAGPPTARAMRATIERLRALGDGPVFVDGAIDRIAALAGGDDAVIVATGAANGATVARVAAIAADAVARLTLPGRDPAHERARVVTIDGALDARDAEALLASARGATVVVADPTRVTVRGALFAALRAAVDLRCERPLRVIACTTSPVGRDATLSPRELVRRGRARDRFAGVRRRRGPRRVSAGVVRVPLADAITAERIGLAWLRAELAPVGAFGRAHDETIAPYAPGDERRARDEIAGVARARGGARSRRRRAVARGVARGPRDRRRSWRARAPAMCSTTSTSTSSAGWSTRSPRSRAHGTAAGGAAGRRPPELDRAARGARARAHRRGILPRRRVRARFARRARRAGRRRGGARRAP